MGKYVLCPRCELNYKLEADEYCDVCKAQLKLGPQLIYSVEDEEETGRLCPYCNANYISDEEDMCEQCKLAREDMEEPEADLDQDESWMDYLDEDEKDAISNKGDEEEMLSLSQLAEEEADELFDDEEEEEYEDLSSLDDEEDDFAIPEIDESDFEEEDEEEEDEDDGDDDF